MDIMSLVSELINGGSVDKMSEKIGASKSQVGVVIKDALPAITRALGKNAESDVGATALLNAIKTHENDDVLGMAKDLSNINLEDGKKMLKHIFGSSNVDITNKLSSKSGVSSSGVSDIMGMLAPVLIGSLGQAQKGKNIDSSGMSGLVNSVLKFNSSSLLGSLAGILDKDKDGSVVDDITGMVGKLFGR